MHIPEEYLFSDDRGCVREREVLFPDHAPLCAMFFPRNSYFTVSVRSCVTYRNAGDEISPRGRGSVRKVALNHAGKHVASVSRGFSIIMHNAGDTRNAYPRLWRCVRVGKWNTPRGRGETTPGATVDADDDDEDDSNPQQPTHSVLVVARTRCCRLRGFKSADIRADINWRCARLCRGGMARDVGRRGLYWRYSMNFETEYCKSKRQVNRRSIRPRARWNIAYSLSPSRPSTPYFSRSLCLYFYPALTPPIRAHVIATSDRVGFATSSRSWHATGRLDRTRLRIISWRKIDTVTWRFNFFSRN